MFNQDALVGQMDSLRKFAVRLTGNMVDAEDLLQSTVLRAIEKQDYFMADTDLFKWTSKIMFNLFVSTYRRKKKFETRYDPETYLDSATVDSEQEAKTELHLVQDAMKELSGEHHEIMVMICVKGMRYQEVAAMLDIPVGTVRSRLSRAREHLQLILDGRTHSIDMVAMIAPDQAGMLEAAA
jgi:RNA polymerase sigma-70 factor (ECF subfamily)